MQHNILIRCLNSVTLKDIKSSNKPALSYKVFLSLVKTISVVSIHMN